MTAEEIANKWTMKRHTLASSPHGHSDFEFFQLLKQDIENVNQEVPSDYEKMTGFRNHEEQMAYEKGREAEEKVTLDWIQKWDGSTNSGMGSLLSEKYTELEDKLLMTDKVNKLLVMALKKLDAEGLKALKDSLEDRLPKPAVALSFDSEEVKKD